jgi:cytidine deaminase
VICTLLAANPLKMPLTPAENSLIDAANAVIDAVPRGTAERRITDHTVGCVTLCSDGRVFTGINVFHFSGGPCAENVAFANASVYTPKLNISPQTTLTLS